MKTVKFAGMWWHERVKTRHMPAIMPAIQNCRHEKVWLYLLQSTFFASHATHATHASNFLKKSGLSGQNLQKWGGIFSIDGMAEYPPPRDGEK